MTPLSCPVPLLPAASVAVAVAPCAPVVSNVREEGAGAPAPEPADPSAKSGSLALHWKVTLSLYQSVPATTIAVAAVLAVTVRPSCRC